MHTQRNISKKTVFLRQNKPSQYVQKKISKTSRCLWPAYIDMFVVNWMFFFDMLMCDVPWSVKSRLIYNLLQNNEQILDWSN